MNDKTERMNEQQMVEALNDIENALADTTVCRLSPERSFGLAALTNLRRSLVSDKAWANRSGDLRGR